MADIATPSDITDRKKRAAFLNDNEYRQISESKDSQNTRRAMEMAVKTFLFGRKGIRLRYFKNVITAIDSIDISWPDFTRILRCHIIK